MVWGVASQAMLGFPITRDQSWTAAIRPTVLSSSRYNTSVVHTSETVPLTSAHGDYSGYETIYPAKLSTNYRCTILLRFVSTNCCKKSRVAWGVFLRAKMSTGVTRLTFGSKRQDSRRNLQRKKNIHLHLSKITNSAPMMWWWLCFGACLGIKVPR